MMKTKIMVIGMFCGRWVQYLYQLWPTPRPSVQQPILLKLPFSCALQKLFSPSKNYSAHLDDVAGNKASPCKALTPLLQTCLHIEQEWNISITVLNWTYGYSHNIPFSSNWKGVEPQYMFQGRLRLRWEFPFLLVLDQINIHIALQGPCMMVDDDVAHNCTIFLCFLDAEVSV